MMNERGIGVGGQAEFVYRTMLQRPRWRMAQLNRVLGWPEERIRETLDELRVEGLLTTSADDEQAVRAVEPCLALPALAARRFQGPAGPGRLPGAKAVRRLISLHERQTEGFREGQLLTSADEIAALVERLATMAQREVVMLVPEYGPGRYEFSDHLTEAVLRSGAELRQVWSAAFAGRPSVMAYARRLGSRGAGPRTFRHVPTRALIVDQAVAVVFTHGTAARVIRESTALDPLIRLAGVLWDSAVEVRPTAPVVPEESARPRQERVLKLLADGLTDEAIARQIGVSVRTVRNDVASAMRGLEARSRFQAGVLATQMGLI